MKVSRRFHTRFLVKSKTEILTNFESRNLSNLTFHVVWPECYTADPHFLVAEAEGDLQPSSHAKFRQDPVTISL
jgi:hypothetical protein